MRVIHNFENTKGFDDDSILSFDDDITLYPSIDTSRVESRPAYNLGFVPDDEEFEIVSQADVDDVVDPSIPSPPIAGSDMGIANQISDLIKDEWEAVDGYNSMLATLADLNQPEYASIQKIVQDIVNEEMTHVGQLETALKLVSPNTESLKSGHEEAMEQISNTLHPFMSVQSHNSPVQDTVSQYDDDPYMTQCSITDVDDTF